MKLKDAITFYEHARRFVGEQGFAREVRDQREVLGQPFLESDLLREAAWVILCSGFREATVRRHFDYISLCYCDWESANAIAGSATACIDTAFLRFRNRAKLEAIANVARTVHHRGFGQVAAEILEDPSCLRGLPWIGDVTWAHLAKNLGFDIAKEDRHVVRIAVLHGFSSAQSLCQFLAQETGDAVACVDITLWRFAAENGTSAALKKDVERSQRRAGRAVRRLEA